MKRIIVITQGLSRIVKPIMCSSICDVVGFIECAPRKLTRLDTTLYKYLRSLYSFLVKKSMSDLHQFAYKNKKPYFYMTSSTIELENWVKSLEPDLIVIFSMSQLLKKNIYSIPRYGTINLHTSFLPEYRGPNPCFWMYYNMDKQGGVTVHYIDEGEDTGNIIYQDRFEIPLGIKSPQKFDIAIDKIGVNLLLKAIDNIERIETTIQPLKSPTLRARNLNISEHKNIIDWKSWPIERIWHVLRGTELWLNALPHPKGIYRGTRWIIGNFEKKVINNESQIAKIYKRKGKWFVVCRDGVIYLDCEMNVKSLIVSILKGRE